MGADLRHEPVHGLGVLGEQAAGVIVHPGDRRQPGQRVAELGGESFRTHGQLQGARLRIRLPVVDGGTWLRIPKR